MSINYVGALAGDNNFNEEDECLRCDVWLN